MTKIEAANITMRAMVNAVDGPKRRYPYQDVFQEATACKPEECDAIYTAITTIGGFSALDHLSRSDLKKMARRVYPSVKRGDWNY